MSEKTKACNLTEDEINSLIISHANTTMHFDKDIAIERINYLNKRLKTFSEPEKIVAPLPQAAANTGAWPTNG